MDIKHLKYLCHRTHKLLFLLHPVVVNEWKEKMLLCKLTANHVTLKWSGDWLSYTNSAAQHAKITLIIAYVTCTYRGVSVCI